MTLKQAKNDLKKYGRVEYRGVVLAETLTVKGNSQEYTGRYRVWRKGESEPLTMESFAFNEAFKFAASYFE